MANGFFKRTTALGASYMLGAFNDNFFKQSALLLAVGLGFDSLQAYGTFLFALPFVLFSAWGGWLADRFPKKRAVIAAKTLELAAMLAGAWGILHLHWGAIMVMLFVMGGSSTLFSPALNGSIPELFPPKQVPKVNGVFKLCTTVAILLGVMLAGAALDCEGAALAGFFDPAIPFGRRLVALGVVTVAALGLCSTIFIPSRPAAATAKHPPFPWLGAWDSLKDYARMRGDRALFLTIAADAFFYGVSSLALLEINALGLAELGFSKTLTSLLPTALRAGICVGSLLAGLGTPESWRRLLPWAAAGIGLALVAAWFFANLHKTFGDATPALFATYGFAGLCGGLYIIPVSSFIQVRPGAGEKGRVLGTNNCLSFTAIMLAGPAYWVLHFVPASTGHLLIGLGTLLVAAGFALAIRRLPEGKPAPIRPAGPVYWTLLFVAAALGYLALTFIGALAFAAVFALAFRKRPEEDGPTDHRPGPALRILVTIFRALLSLRYRVTVTGLDAIEDDGRPILFLPNHAALSDPMIVYSRLVRFAPRPLSDEAQIDRPLIRSVMALVRPVTIPSLKDQGRGAAAGVKESLARCAAALKAGDNLLFYPAGGLTRDGREHLGANSGALRLLEAAPECRVVLVRTRGLWGSSFSYALAQPDTLRGLAKNALRLLANAVLFMPRREVHITVEEARDLPVAAGAKALNRALEDWYEAEPETGSLIPYYFWQGSTPRALPAKAAAASPDAGAEADIPDELRQKVYALLKETLAEDGGDCPEFTPETRLAADMGIDSLGLTELSLALEELAGNPVTRLDALITVEDCVRAAAGLLGAETDALETQKTPEAWFAAENAPENRLDIPEANNLAQAILRQARRKPEALILAEAGAALSWQELWTRALALSLHLRRECPEARVGLMLPASAAACVGWLALLLAGKTPVMLNWTTGPANFGHCVRLSGIRRIVSSRQLLDKLAAQGFEPKAAEQAGASWLPLEEAAANMSPLTKLAALVRGRLALRGLERLALPGRAAEHAAILFTSGSESAPKGVPLTHENILANCRDISQSLVVTSRDRLLAMLPPFHSLGLTVNIALPLCFGIPAVLHPNPTEAARLARLCRRFKPTITAAPPTFLDGLLNQARPGDLDSLRLGVAGAEACPAKVYEKFERITGGALCEGYGVTECAPVVSVNRPENPVAGSIGLPLPSVRVAIVTPEGEPRRVAPGEAGMLLVAGPNVFAGYLAGPGSAPTDPFVDFEGKRWYRTGDLVRQDAEGRLSFAGRLGRFVKLGGEMISLPQMEQALLDYMSKRPAGDAAPPTGPQLAVEALERDGQPEIVLVTAVDIGPAEANQALRAAGLSALYAVRRVLRVEALPLLGSGKTDYRSLKRLIAASCEANGEAS